MHNCEVMLKDMTQSKRINTNIKKPALEEGTDATEEDEEQVESNAHLMLNAKILMSAAMDMRRY